MHDSDTPDYFTKQENWDTCFFNVNPQDGNDGCGWIDIHQSTGPQPLHNHSTVVEI